MTSNQRVTWGYARLSVDLGQAGIENQKQDILKFARARGWDLPDDRLLEEVARAYTQRGQSRRPLFEKLLETADADPEAFRLVIYNLDRLVRDLPDFVRLRDLADRGAEVH